VGPHDDPPPGLVHFGDLRRLDPLSRDWGVERGGPVDRYFVERFLEANRSAIRGRVVAVAADFASVDPLPSNAFDCVLSVHGLQFVYDVRAMARALHRALKPGGVALVTVPGISRIDHRTGWHWTFTALSMRRLFGTHFPSDGLQVETHGNVLAAAAFLYGIGHPELAAEELDHRDPDYEMVITLKARKEH
jgi:SAM-dependent methyltransferase